ncbi:MP99, putative [Leishmania donovani]|uniref:MP99, putative n=1 Tax=Leishmania donovani TaxID=5661 RepID=E9B7S8_LEIDO|nr:MP99, putative [Leishmania donovani]AYU75737.1 mitochondrial protein 99, putative [Leishmania donovani]CBZ31301.1 MP99, putative [Leishmania donovani]
MYAVTRYLCHIAGVGGSGGMGGISSTGTSSSGGDLRGPAISYRNSLQLADAFQPVQHRNQWPFDHVLIDVSFFANSLGYLTRDLVGHERDCETVKNVHRQLQTVILRRLQPRKSLAFLLDGSEPLWMLEHRRLFPGRRYDSRVYRSCASPMPYLLEEKLRGTAMEQRTPPSEAVISGPATPGLAEGKMSAYLLDLATRILRPPTFPPLLDATVTAKDTVCLVGGPELAWLAVGMTPFRNITSVTLQQGELKSCSLQESMVWMRLDHLLRAAPEQVNGDGGAALALQRRLAAVRTDLVLLYLLANGHPTTGLPQVLATPFADVLDAYVDMEKEQHSAAAPSPPQNVRRLRSVLFDEEPVTGTHLEQPGLRLRLVSLQQLLVRIVRALSGAHVGLPAGNRPTPHAATLLEMTLQTHGLLCGGGVPSQAWSPTPDPADGSSGGSSTAALNGTVLLDKFPRLSAEMLLQHVTYLLSRGAKQRTANSADGAGEGSDSIYLSPQRTRHFGLTGVETLLLSATRAEQVNQVLPLYVRGHTLPDEVASDITQTRNIHEAVRKTQRVLSRVLQQASQELASRSGSGTAAVDDAGHNGPHPALAHLPSHLFVRTAGARGPPPGWKYYGVHLGIKAEAMNVRYSLNASDTATLHLIDSNGSSNSGDVIAAAGGEVGAESTRSGMAD